MFSIFLILPGREVMTAIRSERYIASSSDDSLKMAKLYIQLARNYMLNSELEYAYQMCQKATEIIQNNPDFRASLPMDEYYYTFALVGFYLDLPEVSFENYFNLINYNSAYAKLFYLRRLVAFGFRGGEKVELNIN